MNALKPRPPFQVLVMSEESRLGREAIETSYALKQLTQSGVRIFLYLDDREVQFGSFSDNTMNFLRAEFAAEERRKAQQRTYDAMLRKARAGHVTGGRVFGYRNVEVPGSDGQRSHVVRVIAPEDADVVRRIFRLSAQGFGAKAIAKQLNANGARSPRAQQGRLNAWTPSTVWEVLHRWLYRGELVWNQSAKRDRWGRKHQSARPEADWIRQAAPDLRIITDAEWDAAHTCMAASRALYLKATSGQAFGRPPVGNPSPYLLTNLGQCGCCGGTLRSRSRSHGTGRKYFYGCSSYHERGTSICTNNADVPMTDADAIVIEALLDDVLDESIVSDAVDEAVSLLKGEQDADRTSTIEAQLTTLTHERDRLVAAIASGGMLDGLLSALQAREQRRRELEASLQTLRSQRILGATEAMGVRDELLALADDWRRVLAHDPANARPIVSSLLVGRISIKPTLGKSRKTWMLSGTGTLTGLFCREIVPSQWRPQEATPPFDAGTPGDGGGLVR